MKLSDLDPLGLDAAKPVVAVCRSGSRSRTAAGILAEAGIAAYNLAGGMKAWGISGRVVVRDDGNAGTVI
jgi:rhodanese-related sulfurtransferase